MDEVEDLGDRNMPAKELSPIDVYKLLPKTNCKECAEPNCMSFAARLVAREAVLTQCPAILQDKFKDAYSQLWELLKPPVKAVEIGSGDEKAVIGGEYVVHRHEFTYFNPTVIAVDVDDEMTDADLAERVRKISEFRYNYIGQELKLDSICIRSVSGDPKRLDSAVRQVMKNTRLPIVVACTDPAVVEPALAASSEKRPLIHAATRENWKEMADLALMYKCPLVVSAPHDLALLRSMTKTLLDYGVSDLVLDPGTMPGDGFIDTLSDFTMLRIGAIKEKDETLGFPLLGTPIVAWQEKEVNPTLNEWKESYMASALISRYADLLIIHGLDGWATLPTAFLRQNLYTDPRKPVSVEPGVRSFGKPDEYSPVMFTSNFALTYYTVASDIENSRMDAHLLVVDSEGISVESAIAGRKMTADTVAEAIKRYELEKKVRHKVIIIPGRAARISGEIEELTGWKTLVGPMDSSGIPKYLETRWKEEKDKIRSQT